MRRWCGFALSLAVSTTAAAQTTKARDSTGVMPVFVRFADVFGGRLVDAFKAIPASKYAYRPVSSQQTVGYIAQHLENANYGLCERLGARHPRTAKDSLADTVKAAWPKDTLVARLDASLHFCDEALQRLGAVNSSQLASTLLAFETDLAEHYSQISVYMRLLGLVPPSALPPKQRTSITVPESSLLQFVGRYEINPGWDIIITKNNDGLLGRSTLGGDPVRLWPETPTNFFAKEVDAQITFTRGSNGSVNGLVLHQFSRDRSAKKIP
jgi:hypothetical protein